MLQPGTIIGGYRIDELIGRGAMGEVYRAMQLSLKRPVAVKRIAAHLLQEAQAVARFEREAQCVARVQSQHVVAVHDFGRHADADGQFHWLLVMELVDGGTSLGRVIADRGGRLDWRSASSIALQIAEGLAAAAEFSVVHRDIKPDNVLINRRGIAKLTDFGLAKASDSSAMTASGAVLGTPLYMPPEACRGNEVDARGDLYSLGCTWFHCLAGQAPFRAASSVALLRAHCEDPIPNVREFAAETPLAIAELITWLLAKKADDRPASARALIALLDGLATRGITLARSAPEALGSDSQQATAITHIPDASTAATVQPSSAVADGTAATRLAAPTAVTVTPPAPRRQRKKLLVAALIAVIVIVISAVVFMARPEDPRRWVHEALANGDPGMALQRAEALLQQRPNDALAVEAVRESVQAEVAKLCREARYDDARQRLISHRTRHTWLDTGLWERQIAIDEARWFAKHDRRDDAIARLSELRKAAPDDLDICRVVLDTLGEEQYWIGLVVYSAYQLAEKGSGPLEPAAVTVLSQYLISHSPSGDDIADIRKHLLRRHPAIIDTMPAWLDAKDYEQRGNAALMLTAAGKLSDTQAILYHLRNIVELSSSYSIATESLAWLTSEAAKPNWTARKTAASIPPFSTIEALTSWNEHADAAIALLASGFRDEILQPAVLWTKNDNDTLRWNAFRILEQSGQLERIDVPAFHATTLATFHPLYEPPSFTAAIAWCTAQAKTAHADAARAMLDAGIKNIEQHIKNYDKPNMGNRAATCRERLAQVVQIRDALQAR